MKIQIIAIVILGLCLGSCIKINPIEKTTLKTNIYQYSYGKTHFHSDGDFQIHIEGNVQISQGSVDLFFINPQKDTVWVETVSSPDNVFISKDFNGVSGTWYAIYKSNNALGKLNISANF